jgi:hypothetical protein
MAVPLLRGVLIQRHALPTLMFMNNPRTTLLAAALVAATASFAQAQEPVVQTSQVLSDQWFTGPLEASSPALPKAGMIAIEPYEVVQFNTGSFNANGTHVTGSHQARTESLSSLFEYAITDRLSIQTFPTLNYAWNDQNTSRGILASDLPIELKYRFVNQVVNTPIPSATLNLGVDFPTGQYQKLGTGLDSTGSGAYYATQGGTLQWLFNTPGDHPLRIRVWGSIAEPLDNPTVRDISSYGTPPGFRGTAKPGLNGTVGISPEYGLSQRWVLAADILNSYSGGPSVSGFTGTGFVNLRSGSSDSWAVAPAVEYNWSPNYGIIAGVLFNFAGHNASSYVAPQIALNMVF